jgi:STE24 endopeptidase
MNFLSRHFEYQADAFSVSLGYDLGPALVKIHIENMGTLTPDPIYSAYHYSHPTLVERLGYIEKLKQEGKAGKRKTT